MAVTSFNPDLPYEKMTIFSPDGKSYEGYYVDPAIDRNTLPKDFIAYDIRHDDDGCYIFCMLCQDRVFVNNAGSFITQTQIPELKERYSYIFFKIDPEDWKLAHDGKYIPCPENSPTDWEYTF